MTGETAPTGDATEYSYVHAVAEAGATRHYRVRAVSAAGASANSTVAMGTTHDVPGKPTGVGVVAVLVDDDDNTATPDVPRARVSWTAPASDMDITGYTIDISSDAGASWTPTTTTGTDVTYDHTATAGETYYYRISATSAAGTGETSDPPHAGIKYVVPSAPRNLIVRAVDQQESIDLFWDAPMTDGEPSVTGYRIERMSSVPNPDDPANPTVVDWADLVANNSGRSYRDRNLTAGGTYSYRVSAINVVGTGTASAEMSAVSSNKALAPRNLAATVADDMESIVLTWDGPLADEDNPADGGSTITGYQIEFDDGTGWEVVPFAENVSEHPVSGLTSPTGPEFTYTHEDVAAGTSYMYRVSAVNDAGAGHPSAPSASVSLDAVAPGMPTNLTATAAMDAPSIELEWMAPMSNGGADITGYKIEVSEDAEATWADLDVAITETTDAEANPPTTTFSAVHTGLNAGATYHYRVSATNSVGTGDPTAAVSADAPDIPNAPTGLTATADGEDTINLSWTAPAAVTGGSDITGYMIESSPDGTDDSWTELVASQTELTYAHTGLAPNTTVHYRVSAMNMAGNTGAASDPANATTAARGIVTRYAVSEDGSSSATCTDAADPCTLEDALDARGASDNDLILLRIRRVGETATIGDATTINKMVTLGVYVRGASAAAKGAVSFTGSVTMADGGDLMTHKDASIHFDE
ncbi:MAG: fibronectin type III domain-containing protein, partial [Bacteroidetes bacterium]|nr:fibronectin type III domain-containing protein [Bacteroidota bacterium]MDE2672620.1 fibronectin type III domain-containing protein [Bacteroidota bacterium]